MNHDIIYSIKEIEDIIVSSSSTQIKSQLRLFRPLMCQTLSLGGQIITKKAVSPRRQEAETSLRRIRLKISEMKQIHFGNLQECIVTRSVIDSASWQAYLLYKARNPQPIFEDLHPAYPSGKVAMQGQKIRDVDLFVACIPEDFLEFYDDLTNWPVTEASIMTPPVRRVMAQRRVRSLRRCLKWLFSLFIFIVRHSKDTFLLIFQ